MNAGAAVLPDKEDRCFSLTFLASPIPLLFVLSVSLCLSVLCEYGGGLDEVFPVLLCLRHLPLSVLAHLCVYICVKCVREPRKSGVATLSVAGQ